MKKIWFWGQIFLALILALSSLAFIMPASFYEHDLLQSFAVHALAGYASLALLFVLFRTWWLSISAGGAALALLLFLHSYVVQPTSAIIAEGHPFTVAHFNVLASNRQYDSVIRRALTSDADLLSFQEVSPPWAKQLTRHLCDDYPYHHVVTDAWDTQGIAIFSRYPLKNVQTHYWSDLPNITGDIDLTNGMATDTAPLDKELTEALPNDTTVHFVASHTLSPRSESRYRRRNEQIQQIAEHLRSVEGPVLAIGDYNAVPWNPYIVAMKQEAHLYDSRRTFTPTYPSRLSDGGLPIDYVFHSDDFACLDFRAVSAEGSDHRGVVGTYRLKPPVL